MAVHYGVTATVIVLSLIAYAIGRVVYNLYFHPLAAFKGPFSWRASRLPFVIAMLSGELPHRVKAIHDYYGEVVRIAPNELSFIDPAAWKDIYQKPGFVRPKIWRGKPPGAEADNLISATEKDHSRFRKILAPAFSDQAIRKQEPLIKVYMDLLFDKLHDAVQYSPSGQKQFAIVNVVEWFNFTVFDIIGDLGWGSSFNCLQTGELSPWIQVVLHFKAVLIAVSFKFFPPLDSILDAITPKSALAGILQVLETTTEKVSARMASKANRPDIMAHIMAQNQDSTSLHMSKEEIELNSMVLIIAGSESLTTVLTGIVNNLLANPDTLQKLAKEIRSAFKTEAEIDCISTRSLTYLNAVLQEGMRLTPSIPDGSRRDVPQAGAMVAGKYVPGGTTVSIPQWSAYMSPSNFVNPKSFAPERWLGEADEPSSIYRKDRKAIFQPFAYGAHNCLGQPLAWLEMRVIVCRLLWNFDLEVPEGATPLNWSTQQIYWTWEKEPLPVKIIPRGM